MKPGHKLAETTLHEHDGSVGRPVGWAGKVLPERETPVPGRQTLLAAVELANFNSEAPDTIMVGPVRVPIRYVCNPRSRRYILRLKSDGTLRATVPRRGSIREARAFAERSHVWIARQLHRQQQPAARMDDGQILFRGEPVPLTTFGSPLRVLVERQLRRMATEELVRRTLELAGQHGVVVTRVMVRGQRTRWGSCSRRGTISLNWRLIQTPEFVRDYIILHELMHRRQMNHSPRFWQAVAAVCPEYRRAEAWLKGHRQVLQNLNQNRT